MDPHGIEIFNGADDNHVIFVISHYLQLIFLPAQQALFQHDLAVDREVKASLAEIFQFLKVVGDSTAGSAQGEAGPDNHRKADFGGRRFGRAQGVDNHAFRYF